MPIGDLSRCGKTDFVAEAPLLVAGLNNCKHDHDGEGEDYEALRKPNG